MEIIQYIKWTNPGEKEKFESLVKTTKDNDELKQALIANFDLQSYEATTMLLRFDNKIKQIRKNK